MAAKKKADDAPGEIDPELLALIPEIAGFSERLDKLLTKKFEGGYTQTHVASLSALTQPTLSNLLTKPERVRLQLLTVLKIAKGTGISLDALLLGRPDPWELLQKLARQKGLQLDEKPPDPIPLGEPKPSKKPRRRP